MKPRIMILDEPTSMLDPLGKDSIFDILADIKRETDLTVIVVEHNIEQVAPLSDLMVLVYEGKYRPGGAAGGVLPELRVPGRARDPAAPGHRVPRPAQA